MTPAQEQEARDLAKQLTKDHGPMPLDLAARTRARIDAHRATQTTASRSA